jgi:polyvinyl alcohol dehydrogenase (cytochrome)
VGIAAWLVSIGVQAQQLHSATPAATALGPAVSASGAAVYERRCAACHDTGANRAPERFLIGQLSPESVYRALTGGVMQAMAAGLSDDEKKSVAQFLAQRPIGASTALPAPKACPARGSPFDAGQPPPFQSWGLDLGGTHQIAERTAGIDRSNVGRLKLAWAFGFPESQRIRSQPAFAGGALYVGSQSGQVYALDAQTGCARWIFTTTAEVRTGVVVSGWRRGDSGARPLLYFGDITGNVYALDARSGRLAWRLKADPHPSSTVTGTPTLYRDVLYVPVASLEEAPAANPGYACCTFRGAVLALDAKTGRERWRTYLVDPPQKQGSNGVGTDRFGPSGAAVWSAPAIDVKRGLLYVATGDNYSSPASAMSDAIVALDLANGRIRWAYQAQPDDAWNMACVGTTNANCPREAGPDFDFGAAPVLATGKDGKDYVLAGQKAGIAYAIDPDSGRLAWKRHVGRGGVNGGVHFGIAAGNGLFYVPMSDAPDRTRTYDTPANPGLFALDIATGAYAWQAPALGTPCAGKPRCHPGYAAGVSLTSQLVFAGSTDGYVRIFDATNGDLLWQADTDLPFDAVNGVPAHGGAMGGGSAPLAYRGKLYVTSGYGFTGKMPGNALLVYSVQ